MDTRSIDWWLCINYVYMLTGHAMEQVGPGFSQVSPFDI